MGKPTPGNTPRRFANVSALPKVNLPHIRVPQMMDINSYIPTVTSPPFLKEVHRYPIEVRDHLGREVRNLGNNLGGNINRVYIYHTVKKKQIGFS